MKLYLKRNTIDSGIGFEIYDQAENIVFHVAATVDSSLKMAVESRVGEPFSMIRFNTLLFPYFTVRCQRHFYVLVPCLGERFAFAIYGSTYKFSGDLGAGAFTMTDAQGKILMTMEKTLTRSGSEAYELEIHDTDRRMFLISAAICAAAYQVLAEPSAQQACC